MSSSNIGLTERHAFDLVYLATNHGCRTSDEQTALLVLAHKIDRRHGTAADDAGPVERDVIESLHICEKHAGTTDYPRDGDDLWSGADRWGNRDSYGA